MGLFVVGEVGGASVRLIVKLSEKSSGGEILLPNGRQFLLPTHGKIGSLGSFALRSPDIHTTPKTVGGLAKVGAENPLVRVYFAEIDDSAVTPVEVSISHLRATLGNENIEYIEEDHSLILFDTPSDPLFGWQWHLQNDSQSYAGVERVIGLLNDTIVMLNGAIGEDIGLRHLYAAEPAQRKKPIVAILDTGVDPSHPELEGAFWKNPDEIPGNGTDDDHNGLVDDTLGYDFSGDLAAVSNFHADPDPSDQIGHGTHVAGIVAARGNGIGIVGVCTEAAIMAVKMFPNGYVSVAAQSVVYAVNSGADIINASWGSPYESRLMEDAFSYARRMGVFVAASSGNSGSNQRFVPASLPSVFTVGASQSDGHVTKFSTYGAHVDIVAPGRDILSLRAAGTDLYNEAWEPGVHIVDSLYYLADGTSMASPMVAGAAALLWAIRPDMGVADIETILRAGARDIVRPFDTGASYLGPDSLSGAGFLDIGRSFEMTFSPGMAFVSPADFTRIVAPFDIRASGIADYHSSWRLEFSEGFTDSAGTLLAEGETPPLDSTLFHFVGGQKGEITFHLRDGTGRVSHLHLTVPETIIAALSYPQAGDTIASGVTIRGSANGANYDSLGLSYRIAGGNETRLFASSAEFYSEDMFEWNLSTVTAGEYFLFLRVFSSDQTISDSIPITVESRVSAGFPVSVPGFSSITPTVADFDNDGCQDVVVTSSTGVFVYDCHGVLRPGFPVNPGLDCRCAPAIYDINRDGSFDIVFTSVLGLHVVNKFGQNLPGWPVFERTGQVYLGFPTPTVTRLAKENDSAIIFVNDLGQVRARYFNGTPYFYSLGGLFTRIDPNLDDDFRFAGISIPHVSAIDANSDSRNELAISYSSPGAKSGLFAVNGRDGQPSGRRASAQVLDIREVQGIAWADMDKDGALDAVIMGRDSERSQYLFVRRNGESDNDGWPVAIAGVDGWIGSYPAIGDVDGDGDLEVALTFFNYDISRVFLFNHDGSPFLSVPGRPAGEIFSSPTTVSGAVIGDVTGDMHPEIVVRSGYLLPGTGFERIYAFSPEGAMAPGFPITTSAGVTDVFSTPYVPLLADIDGDTKTEIILHGAGGRLTVWKTKGHTATVPQWPRFLRDNLNSAQKREGQ